MARRKKIPVAPVTAAEVMRSRAFQVGFADAHVGRFAIDTQHADDQWDYERGWHFAKLYPSIRRLHDGRYLDRAAVRLFERAWLKGDIL
jgi:hypothetical protein